MQRNQDLLDANLHLPVAERHRSTVDLEDLNNPHTFAVLSISPGARVLDVGCGPGDVARALSERGCSVIAVEMDPCAAEVARPHCEQLLVADAETLDFERAFTGDTFDAILFLDVLEHLRDPAAVLRRVAPLLGDRGELFASIPNVTHGAIRLALVAGRFPYSETGLLDRTHLRFFDGPGVQQLFRESGYRVTQTLRVVRELDETEVAIRVDDFPEDVIRTIRSDPEAPTYQFFVTAVPAERKARRGSRRPGASFGERLQEKIHELTRAVRDGAAYGRHVESELDAQKTRADELEGVLAERMSELDASHQARLHLEGNLRLVESEFAAQKARSDELERILAERMSELDASHQARLHLEGNLRLKDEYIVELRMRVAEQEARTRELDAALQNLLAQLDDSKRALEERSSSAEREIQALHAEIARRQDLIDATHRTRTWRLRAGIRSLVRQSK